MPFNPKNYIFVANLKLTFLMKKILFFIVLLTVFPRSMEAQILDEVNARTSVGLIYRMNDKVQLGAECYVYFKENVTQYDKTALAANVLYRGEILQPGLDYRYTLSSKGNYHDIRYILGTANSSWIKKWRFRLQPSLRHIIHANLKSDFTLWTLVAAEYSLNSLLKPYIFTEFYHAPARKFEYVNQKSAVGIDIKPGQRHLIKTQMVMYNRADGFTQLRPEVTYRFYIR